MKRALACLAIAALAGCAVPQRQIVATGPVVPAVTVHQWGKPIVFGGYEFDFQVASHHPFIVNWVNQVTHAGSNFVVVGVVLTNRTGAPLPHHFQPTFKLVDANRAVYEPNIQQTINLNMGKPGRLTYGQALNPNVPTRLELVFDAPKQPYRMAVTVPDYARAGFAGSINTVGPFFMLDMAPALAQR